MKQSSIAAGLASMAIILVATFQNCSPGFKAVNQADLASSSSVEVPIGTPTPIPTATPPGATPSPTATPVGQSVSLQVTGVATKQGGNAVFNIQLANAIAVPLKINYQTVDGTANSTIDYLAQSTSLTIPAGSVSASISIQTLKYALAIASKNFSINLQAQAGVAQPVGVSASVDILPSVKKLTVASLISSGTVCGTDANGNVGCLSGSDWNLIPGLGVIKSAVSGSLTSCAITLQDTVQCWGNNVLGGLGIGSTNANLFSATPVAVSGLSGVKSLASGYDTVCAILSDDSVKCWGNGKISPTAVAFAPVKMISAGSFGRVCAIQKDDTIRCVTLGNGPTAPDGPIQMVSGVTAKQISVGYRHACALGLDGSVKCWGDNGMGELGNGTTSATASYESVNASVVQGLTSIVSVQSRYDYSCALTTAGTIKCWGESWRWNFTFPSAAQSTPVDVAMISGLKDFAIGDSGGCGLTNANTVKCWNGGRGQRSPIPVDLVGSDGLKSISSGFLFKCGLTNSNSVKCWGDGSEGKLGDGSTANSITPVAVSGLTNVKALEAGFYHACVITSDDHVKCWGSNTTGGLGDGTTNNYSSVPVVVSGLGTVKAIAVGHRHTCALTSQDLVKCWGSNGSGTLGNGTKVSSPIPVDVIGLGAVKAIAAGNESTCAITLQNTVKCWGSYLYNGLTVDTVTPQTLTGIANAVKIDGGGGGYCAADDQNNLRCWGNLPPQLVSNLGPFKSFTVGLVQSCVITNSDAVKCWSPSAAPTPADMFDGEKVLAIDSCSSADYVTTRNTIREIEQIFPTDGEFLISKELGSPGSGKFQSSVDSTKFRKSLLLAPRGL
jgi:alpha-tubulin suppressor-like RCC1 family protein